MDFEKRPKLIFSERGILTNLRQWEDSKVHNCDACGDLVPFVQFKNSKNTQGFSV